MHREVILYETESGNCPVGKFIAGLDDKTASIVASKIDFLQEVERPNRDLLQKMVGTDDLWEVRITHSGNIFRFLGFFDGQRLIILTSGFQKKTQKTPRQIIRTAEARKADYYKRKEV